MTWTIKYNGTEKSVSAWGLENLQRRRANLDIDTVAFIADGRNVDANALFAYGSTIEIFRDREQDGETFGEGTRWFYGRIQPWDRFGDGIRHSHNGTCVGPMWYLANRVFRQTVKAFNGFSIPDDPTSTPNPPITKTFNHIFLNQSIDTVAHPSGKLNWREQVIEAIEWAISCGDPIQIGNITPAFDVPIDEVKNITCLQVLQQMYRWCLDATFWFDYSTQPYPTLHCKRHSELTAVDLNLKAGNLIERFNIRERPDWKRPYVRLQYEQTNNGLTDIVEDIYPDPLPAGPPAGGLETTIDLKGWSVRRLSQRIRTEPYDVNDANWWKGKLKWLSDSQVESVALANVAPYTPSIVPRDGSTLNPLLIRELAPNGGQVADWMTEVVSQRVRAAAWFDVTLKNSTVKTKVAVHHDFVATNAESKVYTNGQGEIEQVGDPRPVGLAQEMWTATQALGAEGDVRLTLEDLPSVVDFGQKLNFTNADQAAWANLGALIQSIEDDVASGSSTIQFGAPQNLNAGELVELLQVARGRFNPSSLSIRGSGETVSAESELPDQTSEANSNSGAGQYQKHVTSNLQSDGNTTQIVHDAVGKEIIVQVVNVAGVRQQAEGFSSVARKVIKISDGTNSITLDLAALPAGVHDVKLREWLVPNNTNGNCDAKALFLSSERY